MLKTRFSFSRTVRRAFTAVALAGVLCGAFTASAQAEEYWRGRNHPQPRQIVRSVERWEHDWHPRHHYRHHRPRYTQIIVQPPVYHQPRVVYYVPLNRHHVPYHHR